MTKVKKSQAALPAEKPITIFLNDEQLVTVMATPDKLRELAVGFLYAEGILKDIGDLKQTTVDQKKGIVWVETKKKTLLEKLFHKRFLTSGCGRGFTFTSLSDVKTVKIESRLKVSKDTILNLMKDMLGGAELYRQSGGIHCSALCDEGGILSFSEDIGRHNTFDKILGECFLNQIQTEDKMMFSTGRISSEMLLKAAKARIPIVVSRSSPTDLSVEIGEKLGVTIIGYVRAGKMKIYSHPERIIA